MEGKGRSAAWPRLYTVAAATYVLDRATKIWAEQALLNRPPIRLIPGVIHLRYSTNSGGAFGLGGGAPWLFAAATIVVSSVIVVAALKVSSPLLASGMGLVLGGALGNLTDRIIRGPGLSGRVIDFIDLRVWPVFNLADSAIVIGVILLALANIRSREGA